MAKQNEKKILKLEIFSNAFPLAPCVEKTYT